MQEHEKSIITLVIIGGVIGLGKLFISSEPMTIRIVLGRTILGMATSLMAGVILIQIPNINPLALIGLACTIAILGSAFIEEYLKKNLKKWLDRE